MGSCGQLDSSAISRWVRKLIMEFQLEPIFHLALYHPEIPPNTGNIGRLCLGIGAALHVVHPIAFSMSDKAVRRAGLDYWKHVTIMEHDNEEAFWSWAHGRRVHLYSTHGKHPYTCCKYQKGDVLLFGRETLGLPKALIAEKSAWRIPFTGPIRSLNLSNAVSVVAYEALQQIQPALFTEEP
jgi:tRNA (cytidine/uridine-2'-O-)-methyltransferase